eukprot:scaffold120446_cov16-Tisochrysis_lutea.AAC.1
MMTINLSWLGDCAWRHEPQRSTCLKFGSLQRLLAHDDTSTVLKTVLGNTSPCAQALQTWQRPLAACSHEAVHKGSPAHR